MIYIGIDPGLTGGIALIDGNRASAQPMPVAGGEVHAGAVAALLLAWLNGQRAQVAIERVGAMPGQGVSSMFKFGCGYGQVRGVCAALGLPVALVQPQAWKKRVLSGLSHDKEGAARYCASRWPGLPLILPRCRKPHDGMADALCIAAWMESQQKP